MRLAIGIAVFFTGLVLLISAFAWGGWGFWVIAFFLDMPTLISILFVNFAVILVTGQFKILIRGKNAILSKKYVISHEDKEKAIGLFRLLSKVTTGAAIMFTLISLNLMLGQLDDISTIGPMISIAMLSIIYGVVLNVIFFLPAIYILEHRQNPDEKIVISEKLVVNKLLELCYKQGISPEEILEADEIHFRK